ncbi:MAG: 6-bladed beta-propeller [Gemmatimonadetes bacterium]|nr:6-bladed beta-propeller [Gemmatimonadota bacterium]
MRWLIALLLLVGCDGADTAHTWSGSVETLANGAIRVTNPAEGSWGEASAWRLTPELQIGEVEGSTALMFASISGLEADHEGRIYILDRQANELRIFNPDGEHLRTVGRAGEGPGEYKSANGLLWLPGDSLLIVDQQGGRYSILTRDGDFARSVPRTLGFYGWAFLGGLVGGRVYEYASVGRDPEQRPALIGTPLRGSSTIAADSQSGGALAQDTILLAAPDALSPEPFRVTASGGGMMMGVPFSPGAVHHLLRDGDVWHGHGSEFRLVRSNLASDTLMEVLLAADAAAVTPAELADWESSATVARFREMGGRLDMSRIPRTKPFFDSLYRDPDGFLWVSVPSGPEDTLFAIFDPEGRYLGRVGVEGFRRLQWVPPVVRNGQLYLAGQDELEVPRVHVYRIER